MTRTKTRFITVLFRSDLYASRFTLGIAELIWAAALLWPGDTFSRPTYMAMSHVMSEEAWAFIFMLSGITQLSILFSGNYHEKFPTIFAAWNSMLWWFLCIGMYQSVSPPPAAISGESALALSATWIWIRSGYELIERRDLDAGIR